MVGEETSFLAVWLVELKFLFVGAWAGGSLYGSCAVTSDFCKFCFAVSHDSTATWDVISQHVHSLQLEVNLLQSRIRVLEDRCDLADQAQDRLDRRVSLLEHWCQSLRNFFARLP